MLTACSHKIDEAGEPQRLPITAKVVVHGQTIDLEVADSYQEQEMGLMYRAELEGDRGMYFPFYHTKPASFWMKNTLIPLDLIFLKRGIIQKVETAQPCKTEACPLYEHPASDAVLELRAGRTEELGLKVGDSIELQRMP